MNIRTQSPKISRPERVFQNTQSRKQPEGQVDLSQGPKEKVTLKGREGTFQPLRSLSGQTLLEQATSSALQVAGAATLPGMVTSKFAPAEFLMLNSGDYHGAQHPVNVAKTVSTLASNAGRSPERAKFLGDVALIHDADERIMLDGEGGYSYKEGAAPARVPVTLAWMDLNKAPLQERFEWKDSEFQEAKALIAGTEHPLNDKARPGGDSAAGLLKRELSALPKERQGPVLEELQIMRFADQSAEYLNGVDKAEDSVRGLSSEISVPADALLKGTPGFLGGLGKDNPAFGDLPIATGEALVKDLGLQGQAQIFSPEQLHGFMSSEQRGNLEAVKGGLGS